MIISKTPLEFRFLEVEPIIQNGIILMEVLFYPHVSITIAIPFFRVQPIIWSKLKDTLEKN